MEDTTKTTRWAMTVFEAEFPLLLVMPELVAEWGWQDERCPLTNTLHRQGYLRTKRQVRFSQLKKILPKVHIEPAKNWDALRKYCEKEDTAVAGTRVNQLAPVHTSMTMAQMMLLIASHIAYMEPYTLSTTEAQRNARRDHLLWTSVNYILDEINMNLVGLIFQPMYAIAWKHSFTVWIRKAWELAEAETDRQIDIPDWQSRPLFSED